MGMKYADPGPDNPAANRRLTASRLGMEVAGELGVEMPRAGLAETGAQPGTASREAGKAGGAGRQEGGQG